jgi:hypothetical protein
MSLPTVLGSWEACMQHGSNAFSICTQYGVYDGVPGLIITWADDELVQLSCLLFWGPERPACNSDVRVRVLQAGSLSAASIC